MNCQAIDAAGNRAETSFEVTVVDATPPLVLSATVSPPRLSPPNRRMVDVVVHVEATDLVDQNVTAEIEAITSDEPVQGRGDRTSPDWIIAGPLTAQLRGEPNPRGDGRTYIVRVKISDGAGNMTRRAVRVQVPRGRSRRF